MKLSFVIPAYNEEHYIGDCLAAIIAQKRELENAAPRRRDDVRDGIEIIVVDNASTDGTAVVVAKYPGVKLVREPEKGMVRARRAGFLASSGDLIANVDADTRLTPGWIRHVMDEFSKDRKLVALSGPFIYYDSPRAIRFLTKAFYYAGYCFYLINRFVFRVGSMLQGGNFVVRRAALEKIGGYDVNLPFWGEDTDIARRMNKVGKVKFTFKFPIYASGRRLAHEGGLTTGLRYAMNYAWITFFKRPFTRDYRDVRPHNGKEAAYAPENKTKEWVIGTIFALILIIIFGGGAYIIYWLLKT